MNIGHEKIEQVDAGNIAVSFKEDSHKSGPIEIKNRNGNIMAKVSDVEIITTALIILGLEHNF